MLYIILGALTVLSLCSCRYVKFHWKTKQGALPIPCGLPIFELEFNSPCL